MGKRSPPLYEGLGTVVMVRAVALVHDQRLAEDEAFGETDRPLADLDHRRGIRRFSHGLHDLSP